MVTVFVLVAVLGVVVLGVATRVVHRVPEGSAGVVDDATGLIAGPALPPGWHAMPPGRRVIRVPLSEQSAHVEDLRLSSADHEDVRADLRVVFGVIDPVRAVREVDDAAYAVQTLSETVLRTIASDLPTERLLASNVGTAARLREVVAEQVEPWGLDVRRVEVTLHPW